MKILETYPDGSRTILYEIGDKVTVMQVDRHQQWLIKAGEVATVTGYDSPKGKERSSIDGLFVHTQSMLAGRWGGARIPPWFLELVSEEKAVLTA